MSGTVPKIEISEYPDGTRRVWSGGMDKKQAADYLVQTASQLVGFDVAIMNRTEDDK